MTLQPNRPGPRVTRRSFLDKALIAVGVASAGVIGGSAFEVIEYGGEGGPSGSAAPLMPVPGPQITTQVTNPHPAALQPATPETTKQLTLEALETTVEIGAGVKYNAFTFGGTVPAPVIHLRQGDTVDFTLKNSGREGHSIDFHAAQIPWDVNYKTILPGASLSFKWQALLPGVFVYHCGTAPVLHHIAQGMYGVIVVDPDPPLEPANEYVLLQSEFYTQPAAGGTWDGDMDKMKAVQPDLLAFNGVAFQYRDNPLPAKAGERVRLYVANIGPTLFSAFHVIGALFDKVLIDGNPANVLHGVQTYTVPPGGGSTFELVIPQAGKYPFVTHSFAYTELGAIGLLNVT